MKIHLVTFLDINKSMRFDSGFHLSEGTMYLKKIRKMPYDELQSLTKQIFTAGRSKRVYTEKEYGYPYLSNSNVVNQSPLEGCKYNSKKHAYDSMSFLKEGMIVTGRVGAIGQTAYINSSFETFKTMGSDNIIRIVPNDINISGYIYAFLASKYGNTLFWKLAAGGVQPYITEEMIMDMPIPKLTNAKQLNISKLILDAAKLRVEANKLQNQAVNYFEKKHIDSNVRLGYQCNKTNIKSFFEFHKRFDAQYQILWKNLISEQNPKLEYVKIWACSSSIFVGGRGKRMYVKNGIPFLSSSDMMLFNPKRGCKYVSKNTPGFGSMKVSKKDILISRSGTVGNTVLVGDDLTDVAISEHALRLVVDPEVISPNYVYCFLKTKYGTRCMEASSFGSVIITLNEDLIGNIDLPVLPAKDQKHIENLIEEYLINIDLATKKESEAIDLIEKEIESWQK